MTHSDPELHARRASSFGDEAAAYARHRPDYPAAALEWAVRGAGRPVREVLDLAAGTGKLTAGLAELGLCPTAVEPDPGMRAELSRLLPGVPALAGKAEDIPLPAESMDAVFIGQALHWFDLEPAFAEIRRVLRPGGVVAPLWNHEDASVPWVVEFSQLIRTRVSSGFADGEETLAADGFGQFEQEKFPHSQWRTIDSLLATVATHSHLLVANSTQRMEILDQARGYLESVPEVSPDGFAYPLTTTVFRARRS
ncbi:class I SAM-dependent methyltransferase [Amycolatopsis benzoatilytica]|uniref:class I SAM-dependent methyltransferase n=1 Tax=Amycolatopsis benzoatilytica TaxID=346045 RepID=UPI00037616A7|nr:class I SAM-dependent methyltransferase [Amycolatopsis benzoatilytica]